MDQNVEERLIKLERAHRRLKRLVGVAVLVVAVLLVMGQTQSARIYRALQFQIVSGMPNTDFGFFGRTAEGSQILRLGDQALTGNYVEITNSRAGAQLVFVDAQGVARFTVGLNDTGTLALGLSDSQSIPRLGFMVSAGGSVDAIANTSAGAVSLIPTP